MSGTVGNRKLWLGGGLAGVALVWALAMEGSPGAVESDSAPGELALISQDYSAAGDTGAGPPMTDTGPSGSGRLAEAQQALSGLAQIRQQQCQSGNQLACQALPEMPRHQQKLASLDQGCRSGDSNACGAFQAFAQQIFTAYSESAAVMQAGEAGMAQMDAWRGQMNRNAAASMANLQARAAAGQMAHNARQEANAAMTRGWEAAQASSDRTQGRFIDGIYEGTTMHGGGVQSRIDNGSRGYTDGYGNVVAVPDGSRAPDGWQAMDPTYAVPQ